jgi:hypothetical protein
MENLPIDFDWFVYNQLNEDLREIVNGESVFFNEEKSKMHYTRYGFFEGRKYKVEVPDDFDWIVYNQLNEDLRDVVDGETLPYYEEKSKLHYSRYGFFEGRKYKLKTPNELLYYIKPYKNPSDISMFLSKQLVNNSNNSFIKSDEISQNLPRGKHNSKEKINIDVLESCILIIDFHNGGGGTSVFIESIISRYKKYQTFLIARNFDGKIYFTINDDYELEQSYNDDEAYYFLSNNKKKIEKIFINHTLHHSYYFLNNLFLLEKEITTITHDFLLLFNDYSMPYNDMDNYIVDETKYSKININKYSQIITQNISNLYIYNNYIEDKNKIIITPLPDYKNSKNLINTSNSNIVIGIIGGIHNLKGSEQLKQIIEYYKNTNVKIIVFGGTDIITINNCYPYNNIHELNELLIIHKPNILIELSIWHESYSYTLTLGMITQLPILYLKKNGISVIENRLSEYNKAYEFSTLYELDNLVKSKKQDFFYTIEPVIYFNDFWDNYFTYNSYKNQLDIKETYINKNVILMTSKLIVSSNSYTYVKLRSIYTKEQRFIQTLNTIKSIRKHIPNSYIVLIDNSELNKIESEFLKQLTDYFINITTDNELNYHTNENPLKLFGELKQQLVFYENFIKKIDIKKINHFFKISGRYFINDSFNYNDYDNDLNILKKNEKVTDRDYYYTSFYKLNNDKLLEYFDELNIIFKERDNYNENTINDFEVIIPSKISDKFVINNLGITQIISVWNIIDEI